jgi:hypothetical protein
MATITVQELALALDTDPRTTRKFLRSIIAKDAQPGKGGRWAIEKRDVRPMKSKFAKWTTDQEAKRAEREAKRSNAEAIDANDEAIELEPTDAELEEIDATE